MRIKEALVLGKKTLSGRQCALLETQILLMHLLKLSREKLFMEPEKELNKRDEARFKKFLRMLTAGYPISYITGEKEFYGEKFFVDKNVLIPRPETELLVDETIKIIKKNFFGKRVSIADVGSGSGCVGISIAKNCTNVFVIGVDIPVSALKIARKNARKLGVSRRVKFIQSSLLNKLFDQKIDIIVANLPYIGTKKYNFVERNVRKYEPHEALYAGKNGLRLYEKFFKQVAALNHPPKFILGEFGYGQGKELRLMLNKYFVQGAGLAQARSARSTKPGAKYEIKKDYAGIERIFIINLS
ncbi:peptide chain release factor N(5)-glutamine methyltransferase [Candidatus Peregrinibacteria bacterium]|nr:peptide chain release factor N(5)-glutamine methyltransferase [Candidatus Peregrinibacteria bacterium]